MEDGHLLAIMAQVFDVEGDEGDVPLDLIKTPLFELHLGTNVEVEGIFIY